MITDCPLCGKHALYNTLGIRVQYCTNPECKGYKNPDIFTEIARLKRKNSGIKEG